MLDERTIEKLEDHLTAPDLVDILGLSVAEIIDAFEIEVQEKLPAIEDTYGLEGLEFPESEE